MFDLRTKTDEPYYSFKAHSSAINCVKFYQSSLNFNSLNNSSINSTQSLNVPNTSNSYTALDNLYNVVKKSSSYNQDLQQQIISNTTNVNYINNGYTNGSINIYSPETQNTFQTKTNANTILKESINTTNQINETVANDSFILCNNNKKNAIHYSKSTSNLLIPGLSSTKNDSTNENKIVINNVINDGKV
jgi:hypothetical protein